MPIMKKRLEFRGVEDLSMATFYILVMDRYRNDPSEWIYSASASTEAELINLRCFQDPPHGLPKNRYTAVTEKTVSKPPCSGGPPEGGTIYGIA
jgi:hypothetical protein